jgi:hypothetical protein
MTNRTSGEREHFWADRRPVVRYSSFDIKASISSYQRSHIMQFKCLGIFVAVLLTGIATVAFGQGVAQADHPAVP